MMGEERIAIAGMNAIGADAYQGCRSGLQIAHEHVLRVVDRVVDDVGHQVIGAAGERDVAAIAADRRVGGNAVSR